MDIPNRLSTIDQVGDWIKDCPYLNRSTVCVFLTEPDHEPVLEYISYFLSNLNSNTGLVDNLKVFLGVVGAMENPEVEADSTTIQRLLEQFSKGFCDSNVLSIQDWKLVSGICMILLQMNKSMRNNEQITTMQNFFVDIRALNSTAQNLPSRIISDIYNDFTTIGPFKQIQGRKCPDSVLMTQLRSGWMTVHFGLDDEEPRELWVVVSSKSIYLFTGVEKRPYGCIFLPHVRVSLGRLLQWTVELHSKDGIGVPFVRFDPEAYYCQNISYSDVSCIPFIALKIQDPSSEALYSFLDLLESCCWNCWHVQ